MDDQLHKAILEAFSSEEDVFSKVSRLKRQNKEGFYEALEKLYHYGYLSGVVPSTVTDGSITWNFVCPLKLTHEGKLALKKGDTFF